MEHAEDLIRKGGVQILCCFFPDVFHNVTYISDITSGYIFFSNATFGARRDTKFYSCVCLWPEAAAAVQIWSSLFLVVIGLLVARYRLSGQPAFNPSSWSAWPLKTGPIFRLETSVTTDLCCLISKISLLLHVFRQLLSCFVCVYFVSEDRVKFCEWKQSEILWVKTVKFCEWRQSEITLFVRLFFKYKFMFYVTI
jgi:hypothetical protein